VCTRGHEHKSRSVVVALWQSLVLDFEQADIQAHAKLSKLCCLIIEGQLLS